LPFSHHSFFFSLNLDKNFFFGNPVIGNLTTLHRKWFAVAAAAANVSSFWTSPFINLDVPESVLHGFLDKKSKIHKNTKQIQFNIFAIKMVFVYHPI